MKKYFPDFAFLFLIALSVVVLDQLSKSYVRNSVPIGEMWAPWPWLLPYARLVHWTNTGAAFGMFQRFGGLFTILAIVVSGVILYYFPQIPRKTGPCAWRWACSSAGQSATWSTDSGLGRLPTLSRSARLPCSTSRMRLSRWGVAILVLDLLYKDWQKRKFEKLAKDSATLQGEDPAGGGGEYLLHASRKRVSGD